MKADRSDAPEWIRSNTRRKSNWGVVIPGVIGLVVTLGALNIAGQAFLQSNVQKLVGKRQQPRPAPVAEITRSEPAPRKDWDRLVEQQARQDAMSQQPTEQPTSSESPAIKQTVFNDQNYAPRGADNVLSFRENYHPIEPERPAGKVKVTVVEQTPSMKERACWPHKEGSVERRNCKLGVGLHYRD